MEDTLKQLAKEVLAQSRLNSENIARQSVQIQTLAEQMKEMAMHMREISVTKETVENFSKRVDSRCNLCDARFDKIETRIEQVEQRPAKEALNTVSTIKNKIRDYAIIGVLLAVVTFIASGAYKNFL